MEIAKAVLVIDDDPAMLESLSALLQLAGFAPTVARDAFAGLKLARTVKPAAILCDMQMPNMAGSDLFRALASDPGMARIPRIMMSGHENPDCSCANAFLAKPFTVEEMVETLDRSLAKRIPLREAYIPAAARWE